VRLGRKINYGRSLLVESIQNRVPVSNVAFDETMAILVDALEVIEISSVGECVESGDLARGKITEEVSNKSRPDKSRSARNEKLSYSFGHDYFVSWSCEQESNITALWLSTGDGRPVAFISEGSAHTESRVRFKCQLFECARFACAVRDLDGQDMELQN
jgi:hypothetical protein